MWKIIVINILTTEEKKRKGSNLWWAHQVSYETMRRDDRMLVCSRWQQSVESDSTPADPTEEETLPWTLLHGVRLSVTPRTAQLVSPLWCTFKTLLMKPTPFSPLFSVVFLLHDSFQSVLFCIFSFVAASLVLTFRTFTFDHSFAQNRLQSGLGVFIFTHI